jgi:hypothetical protein
MAQGPPEGRTSQFVVGQEFNPYRLFKVNCIPEAICRYRGLSDGAKLAYGRLMRYAGEDGNAFPAVGTLADEIGKSINQARRCLQELSAKQFIKIAPTAGRQNHYKFLWHAAFRNEPAPAPLPYVGGVEPLPQNHLSLQNKGIPLPSMGALPLPSMGAPPLPHVGDEESQCKESQGKRVSQSARETIRRTIDRCADEEVRTDGPVGTILEAGKRFGFSEKILVRWIEDFCQDCHAKRKHVDPGLVQKAARDGDIVMWARRSENRKFIDHTQDTDVTVDERIAEWEAWRVAQPGFPEYKPAGKEHRHEWKKAERA